MRSVYRILFIFVALACAGIQGRETLRAAVSRDVDELYRVKRIKIIAEKDLENAEKNSEVNSADLALNLNNIAGLYYAQGLYAEAEPLFRRALAIREKLFGSLHPDVALSLNNLALLYNDQGNYHEATPLLNRSLAIWEKTFGPYHTNVAVSLNNLAVIYVAQRAV